jgi:hypothetical protein
MMQARIIREERQGKAEDGVKEKQRIKAEDWGKGRQDTVKGKHGKKQMIESRTSRGESQGWKREDRQGAAVVPEF